LTNILAFIARSLFSDKVFFRGKLERGIFRSFPSPKIWFHTHSGLVTEISVDKGIRVGIS
jgi:hypothetical protein